MRFFLNSALYHENCNSEVDEGKDHAKGERDPSGMGLLADPGRAATRNMRAPLGPFFDFHGAFAKMLTNNWLAPRHLGLVPHV